MYIKRSYIAPQDNTLEVWALLAPYISIVAHFGGKVNSFCGFLVMIVNYIFRAFCLAVNWSFPQVFLLKYPPPGKFRCGKCLFF